VHAHVIAFYVSWLKTLVVVASTAVRPFSQLFAVRCYVVMSWLASLSRLWLYESHLRGRAGFLIELLFVEPARGSYWRAHYFANLDGDASRWLCSEAVAFKTGF